MFMEFNSLTVLDFFEDSETWKEDEFIENCRRHKKELENIRILRKHHRYYSCRLEIEHLIDFIRKLLWYNQSDGTYPAGMSQSDYELMIKIFKRYNPNMERKHI